MNSELIDRYVAEVGRRLPRKQREDIEKELKSSILDALEAKASGREPTDEDVAAVLREFGSPAEVAARYCGERYVVGPGLYPTYARVLGVVLGAVALGLFLSSFAVPLLQGGADRNPGWLLVQFLGGFISSGWAAVGVVTVIFWGIERGVARAGERRGSAPETWDPATLPPVQDKKNAWKPADSIASIVFGIIGIILFNAYSDVIAVSFRDAAGQWQHIPILSRDALAVYLPLWNAGWVLSIAVHAAALMRGRWRLGANVGNIVLQIYSIVVLSIMFSGPALLSSAIANAETMGGSQQLVSLMESFRDGFHWFFLLAIFGCMVELIKTVVRMVRDGVYSGRMSL